MTSAIRSSNNRFKASAINDERGLSTVEYTIILLLIAVFAIVAWTGFGKELNKKITESTTDLQGISAEDVQADGQSGG